jgi:hypothetical protein
MIVNHRSQDDLLELLRQDKIPLGKGIGVSLDNHLRFKEGTFNIILGHANVGKTYWLLWYLLTLSVKYNLKHLIYSSENSVFGIKRNLIELCAKKRIKDMSEDELNNYKNFIEAQKAWTIEDFMREVQELGKYDALMIDPHNSFLRPKGSNAHDYDYEMATRLRLFAKKTNTSIYLCIHAATDALRKTHKDGEYNGLPMPPSMADAEGGGKWGNRADDFLVIHRYPAHESSWMFTEIHVKKVKETETGGAPTFLNTPVLFRLEYGTIFTCEGISAI